MAYGYRGKILVGTLFPTSARSTFTALSPLTGIFGDSNRFGKSAEGSQQNSELLMCRKIFTLIFTTNFVGSLDIRASREVFPIGVRSPEITKYHRKSYHGQALRKSDYVPRVFQKNRE